MRRLKSQPWGYVEAPPGADPAQKFMSASLPESEKGKIEGLVDALNTNNVIDFSSVSVRDDEVVLCLDETSARNVGFVPLAEKRQRGG